MAVVASVRACAQVFLHLRCSQFMPVVAETQGELSGFPCCHDIGLCAPCARFGTEID